MVTGSAGLLELRDAGWAALSAVLQSPAELILTNTVSHREQGWAEYFQCIFKPEAYFSGSY